MRALGYLCAPCAGRREVLLLRLKVGPTHCRVWMCAGPNPWIGGGFGRRSGLYQAIPVPPPTEAPLWRAGGNRRLNIVSQDVEIDSHLFEKFAFVKVGGQPADEVTILCLNEKLLELGAQIFHS